MVLSARGLLNDANEMPLLEISAQLISQPVGGGNSGGGGSGGSVGGGSLFNLFEHVRGNIGLNELARYNVYADNHDILTITAEKVWEGGDKIAKPHVTIILLQDGQEIERQVLAAGSQTVTWKNLPVFNSDGQAHNYTVAEDFQSKNFVLKSMGQTEDTRFIITNKYVPDQIELQVEKFGTVGLRLSRRSNSNSCEMARKSEN